MRHVVLFVIGTGVVAALVAWLIIANVHVAPQPVITAAAAVVGVVTFLLNTWQTQRHQRKQHTIRILLETRLSAEYRGLLSSRSKNFPAGTSISPKDFDLAHSGQCGPESKRSANSLVAILNHYEFIAVAIDAGDLDEQMMRRTVRGLMCNLVHDCRYLIPHFQSSNSRLYEALVDLFNRWRDPTVHDAIEQSAPKSRYFVPSARPENR